MIGHLKATSIVSVHVLCAGGLHYFIVFTFFFGATVHIVEELAMTHGHGVILRLVNDVKVG